MTALLVTAEIVLCLVLCLALSRLRSILEARRDKDSVEAFEAWRDDLR